MSFSKFKNPDGSLNHKKIIDEQNQLEFELVYSDEKSLKIKNSSGQILNLMMNTDGGDVTIALPKKADKLRPKIKEAIIFFGLRDPFFIQIE